MAYIRSLHSLFGSDFSLAIFGQVCQIHYSFIANMYNYEIYCFSPN